MEPYILAIAVNLRYFYSIKKNELALEEFKRLAPSTRSKVLECLKAIGAGSLPEMLEHQWGTNGVQEA